MKDKNPEVVKLQKQIEGFSDDIEDNPKSAKAYSEKAKALVKLKEITGRESYSQEALTCYNEAVKLDKDNALYLSNRGKLHTIMGNPELAVEDIKKAGSLPQSSDPLTAKYLNITMRDIAKLDAVQSAIQKLQAEGKIDQELATTLAEHAKVTENLVVQIGCHGERLNGHDQEIAILNAKTEELVSIVKALSEGRKVDSEQITKLIKDTCTLREEVEQNNIKIQGIEEQLSSAITDMKKGIASSKESDVATKNLLEAKISSMESQLSGFAKQKDVSKIVLDMKKMIGENKFTKESLEDLQSQIDEMKDYALPVITHMFTEVKYDNPLLNHPKLLKGILAKTSLDEILNLDQRLSTSLISEAAENNDTELLLVGLESLGYSNTSQ